MPQQLKVFVSHSHEDDAFCRDVVGALRGAGADVWYDEHNLGSGQLMEVIQRELEQRPIFVLILSKHAFASRWVKREATWAFHLGDRDPSRLILPMTASPIEDSDFSGSSGWLFLHDFKRIEAAGMRPCPITEACGRLLHTLALIPDALSMRTAVPVPMPQPSESLVELLSQAKALIAQDRFAEAIPLLERATKLDPNSVDAWAMLGLVYSKINRSADGLSAYDRALALDGKQAWVWNNKGCALCVLHRYQEALAAHDHALDLDPHDVMTWNNKGYVLDHLKRHEQALVAYDRSLALDPKHASTWNNRASTLKDMRRYSEALMAAEQSLSLDPTAAAAWGTKGQALLGLNRYEEALTALDRSLALNPKLAECWNDEAAALRVLGRTAEAEQAERRARELG